MKRLEIGDTVEKPNFLEIEILLAQYQHFNIRWME